MTHPTFTTLTLAAYGWSPVDWQRAFYPDDLPSDWQVSYYANEFSSVLLPATAWGNVPLADAAYWRAEVGEDFSFYVEVTPALLRAECLARVQQAIEQHLAAQLAGMVVTEDALSDLPAAWLNRFEIHTLQPAQCLATMPVNATAQLGIVRALQPLTALALRELFETLQQQTAHKDVVLFLDVPYTVVEQIRWMQQLYGVWNTAG
ncbi:MAG: hypothetical protein ACK4RS_04305 [Thiothrix sp.]